MKKIIHILSLLICYSVSSQVTIIVDSVPQTTPDDASIFISGNFEGWTGGQKKYQLNKKNNSYLITLPQVSEKIHFKFTQGSWNSVEASRKGLSIDNRSYSFKSAKDTIRLKIDGWAHLFNTEKKSTATDNVTILSKAFNIPQLNRKRRVWLYLPPDYETSNESYPVVYMHDGQNLFDSSSSFSGEWSVDETLNRLYNQHQLKVIVVGIDNGGDKRLDEYSPWSNSKYGGGEGEAYSKFIVETLKPYVDSNFKTLKDRANTAIIGSSMGGLISHYAGLKYSNTFGKVGVFSPAFWFSPEVHAFSETYGQLTNSKFYFLAGGKEGANVSFEEISETVLDMNSVIKTLKKSGFNSENIKSKVVPEGKHNEELWRTNFAESMLWLFSDKIKKRTYLSHSQENGIFSVTTNDGKYEFQFYSKEILETTFIPNDESEKSKSHAVIMEPKGVKTNYSYKGNVISYASENVSVSITTKPFQVQYFYNGKPILSEKRGYYKSVHQPMEMVAKNIVADSTEKIEFNLTKDEVLYGGGARALGMNRRGNRLPLFNRAHYGYETRSELMNYTMPIVLSSKKYMLHFDNAPVGYLDLDSNKDNTLTYETISGRKTYQIIAGNSWYDIIDNYTNLTGKQPMLPRWALGNFSSRFGYHSQREVEATIAKFKEEEIPVDAIILDLYWFGKEVQGTMGNLEFYRDSFPNPKEMIKGLKAQNVETILITEPFVLTTSNRWEEAVAINVLADSIGKPATYDFYFGNTGIIDIYKPQGKKWFSNIYKDLAKLGVTGFWGDLGEPEVHPNWVQHAAGSAQEVHNIYGHDWAKLVYEASLEASPSKRPFILMRAGYSGSQRYGMVPWSGDVNRTWGGLQSQPEIALQMGMQGLSFMHSDLGGFAGANLDDNLYVRWLQYGVFQPIFRPHAQEDVASEPIYRSDKAKRLASFAIEMRYRMLPYNYNMMYQNHTSGKPLMRPLFFEDDTPEIQTYSESYLWGDDILVSPILKDSTETQRVYFPKNSKWFNIETDKIMDGGQYKNIKTHPAYIPTYVRAGAFIPLAKSMQSTKAYDANYLQLQYYHDKSILESKREFYFDDGITKGALTKGKFQILEFKSELRGNQLVIMFKAKTAPNYSAESKSIDLTIHNIKRVPKKIKINGNTLQGKYSLENKTLTLKMSWDTSREKEIKIKF